MFTLAAEIVSWIELLLTPAIEAKRSMMACCSVASMSDTSPEAVSEMVVV